jgi:phage-related protein
LVETANKKRSAGQWGSASGLTFYLIIAIMSRFVFSRVPDEFAIEYVVLPNGRFPAREFVDSLDEPAAARIDAFNERLRIYGNRMQGKFVKQLGGEIFELRIEQYDRIFRILFCYQPSKRIIILSGFQKKTDRTPSAEIAKAEHLRQIWIKHHNRYTGSSKEVDAIQKE